MKISKILRKAADTELACGTRSMWKHIWSCNAVAVIPTRGKDADAAYEFLEELGLWCGSSSAFDEFPSGAIRQGARFLWLDFAALVAESEGL